MSSLRKAYPLAMCCLAALALLAAPASATVVVGNGGFETAGSGGAADSDMWTEFASVPGNVSERSTLNPASGAYSHRLFAQGQAALGTVAAVFQNSGNDVGLPSLAPGSTLSASFDAMTPFGPGGVMNYTLRILNGAGAIVQIYNGFVPSAASNYRNFTTPNLTVPAFGAAPNNYYVSYFEVNVAAGGFIESTSTAYLDNISINGTLVPEPSALALLACGALALLRRR